MNQTNVTPMAANQVSQPSNSIKFTDEEVKVLVNLKEKYQKIITNFGQLYIERVRINDYISQLNETESKMQKEYTDCQKEEDTILASLTSRYGEGSLDIVSGVFIPKGN